MPHSAEDFEFWEGSAAPGTAAAFEIPVSRDAADHAMTLPVRLFHGVRPGPVLFVSAAVHGDEITGVEIIRRLLGKIVPAKLAGTLICVPIVNIFGFVANSRYLPDRRDLNRSFPGSEDGPLASRLAWLFHSQIVARADFGIDLHAAALHRYNLPQIRISPGCAEAARLAEAFSPPAIITSPLREKSLRAVALEAGVEMLLYEAGEALRFDDFSIRVGLNGVMRCMEAMGMIELKQQAKSVASPVRSERSIWLRAPRGGICRMRVGPGAAVEPDRTLALVSNPVGSEEQQVTSPVPGIVIGLTRHGVVNRGDALLHIAQLGESREPLDPETEARLAGAMLDEHEII